MTFNNIRNHHYSFIRQSDYHRSTCDNNGYTRVMIFKIFLVITLQDYLLQNICNNYKREFSHATKILQGALL